MSKCETIRELISAMLDGELSQADAETVRAHIAECDDCRAMYQAFQALSAGLTAEEPVPEDLHENIMSTVRAADQAMHRQKKLIRLRSVLALAACLIVVVGTVFAFNSSLFRMGSSGWKNNSAMYNEATTPMAPSSAEMADSTQGGPREPGAAPQDPGAANGNVYGDALPPAGTSGEVPMATSTPEVSDGKGASQRLTLEVLELAEGRMLGTVIVSVGDIFAVGQELTVVLPDAAAGVDSEDSALLEVEFDRWEEDLVYARSIRPAA